MTEREAIEYINRMRNKFITNKPLEALDFAISALEKQEQDRWISVKDGLPENKKKVLVSYDTEDGKKVDISMFDRYGCLLGLVDAWMPLPEPYTEEET